MVVLEGAREPGRFMSHTKWQWRVRLRAVMYLSCIDIRTMKQKMERGRINCSI